MFPSLQKALVHENIIQQLSKPHRLSQQRTVRVGDSQVMLQGHARSHYAALSFVNSVVQDEGGLLSELTDIDAARLNTIQTRYVPLPYGMGGRHRKHSLKAAWPAMHMSMYARGLPPPGRTLCVIEQWGTVAHL